MKVVAVSHHFLSYAPKVFRSQKAASPLYTLTGMLLVVTSFAATAASTTIGDVWGGSSTSTDTAGSSATSYDFNSSLLLGTSIGSENIDRFNHANVIDPGRYTVDIYINGSMQSRKTIEFVEAEKNDVYACLTDEFLLGAGLMPESIFLLENDGTKQGVRCLPIGWRIKDATAKFTVSNLRLDVSIPQALMKNLPSGYVNPDDLDIGDSMLFLNYDSNNYKTSNYGSSYLGINAGFNLGMWRFRQVGNYNYQYNDTHSSGKWQTVSSYVVRSLPAIQSEMTIGDTFNSGNLLSSFGFRGVTFKTDERMLPDSQQGYAPVVRGVALTNARVTVRQGKNELFQTTVAPGPFEFKDIHPNSLQGDLQVEVVEADGHISTFTVPFSAVPESMREGATKYSLSMGKVTQVESVSPYFIDWTYQRGISNSLTANTGLRFASGYQSALGGLVLGSSLGAMGVNVIYSSTKDNDKERLHGWRVAGTYSHTIQPTQTTLALAGYRYSTKGYRDLLDVLGSRNAQSQGANWDSTTFQQRNQFVLSIGQGLGTYGQLYASVGISDYYAGKDKDTQFQIGYSNSYKSLSYNIAVSRQKTGLITNSGQGQTGVDNSNADAPTSNMVMVSVSMPIGPSASPHYLSSSVTSQSGNNMSYQTSVAGTLDEDKTVSYGLALSAQDLDGKTSGGVSANVQKQFALAGLGASYSAGQGYWQVGMNMRGAAVLHSGGVTLGPYVGETFGLIEAPGAQGALVRNGMGASIDSRGYAIVPNLMPFRYNEISLDSKGINNNAELTGVQQKAAPFPGAAIKFKFETKIGRALLIKAFLSDGGQLPLGSPVFNAENENVGMVGQGGRIYARTGLDQGQLTVKWGKDNEKSCVIPYNLNELDKSDDPLIRLVANCDSTI